MATDAAMTNGACLTHESCDGNEPDCRDYSGRRPAAVMTTRLHVTMTDSHRADGLALTIGGALVSTTQRYNDAGDDLALIDVDAAELEHARDVLDADDGVVSYSEEVR